MLDYEESKKHLQLLIEVLNNDQPDLVLIAIKSLFDILLIYGKLFIKEEQEKNEMKVVVPGTNEEHSLIELNPTNVPSISSIFQLLKKFLHDEDIEFQTIAVEGFTKLLFNNVIKDPSIFNDIVLLFFDPSSEDAIVMRQCLSLFFPVYSFSSYQNQLFIQSQFIPIVRSILYAPTSSSIRKIQLATVAQFLVYLTNTNNLQKKTENSRESVSVPSRPLIHNEMCISLLYEILANPTGSEGKSLSKVLSMFVLQSHHDSTIKTIRYLMEKLVGEVEDKVALRTLNKFESSLVALDTSPDETLSVEKKEKIDAQIQSHKEEKTEEEINIISGNKSNNKRQPAKKGIGFYLCKYNIINTYISN